MTHLHMLRAILDHQSERGIKSNDWKRLDYDVSADRGDNGNITLGIPSLKVAFYFSAKGRLIGAFNWKE